MNKGVLYHKRNEHVFQHRSHELAAVCTSLRAQRLRRAFAFCPASWHLHSALRAQQRASLRDHLARHPSRADDRGALHGRCIRGWAHRCPWLCVCLLTLCNGSSRPSPGANIRREANEGDKVPGLERRFASGPRARSQTAERFRCIPCPLLRADPHTVSVYSFWLIEYH